MTTTEAPATVLDVQAIQRLLPHRPPFLLVDRVCSSSPQAARGLEGRDDERAVLHRPLPRPTGHAGVSILEALAQAAALLACKSMPPEEPRKITYLMGIDGARFRKPVVPGDRLELGRDREAEGRRLEDERRAIVDGQTVAEAEFLAMIADRDDVA